MADIDYLENPYSILFLVFWCFWTLFFAFNVYLFFKHRSSMFITSRSPWLIFFSALGQYGMMTFLSWKIIVTTKNFPNMCDLYYIWFFLPLHFLPYPVRSLRFIFLYNVAQNELRKPDERNKFWSWVSEHHKITSDAAFMILNWFIMIIALIVGISRNIIYPENHPGQMADHGNSDLFYYCCMGFALAASAFTWAGLFFMRKITDELKVRFELLIISIAWIIFIGAYCIIGLTKIGPEQTNSIILIVLCIISFLVTFGLPIHLSIVKPPISSNEGTVKLETFLDDPKGSKLLHQFAIVSLCPQNYLFIHDIKKYHLTTNQTELERMNYEIKNKYIKKGSRYEVNIPATMNALILANTNASNDSFDPAYNEVMRMWRTDLFPKFKITPEAKTFIREIKTKHMP